MGVPFYGQAKALPLRKVFMTIQDIQNKKQRGEKITMLTAYDYVTASAVDESSVDMILVGDSLANVVLGLASTREVTMDEMIHHAKAVRRGVKKAFLVGDMPYAGYQENPERAVVNALRFKHEAGCDAVKIEWFDRAVDVSKEIIQAGVPVIGHVGLTPQTADKLGGFKVQGKNQEAAQKILEQARQLEEAGCFAIVLECIPAALGKQITTVLSIPTIGIGAGVSCNGQVLVIHDLLGLTSGHHPKFVKTYVNLREQIASAISQFKKDVKSEVFPDDQHSYH